MKKNVNVLLCTAIAAIALLFSGCATICGGAMYYAHVKVKDHPNAKITVNGEYKGMGETKFKHARRK